MSKGTVYAYVGHNRGVAVDLEGNKKRNEWVKLNLELDMEECIEKLSWRAPDNADGRGSWGSNNIVIRRQDLDTLVGKILTLCDAMIGEQSQREAWKSILRTTIHEWHDEKYNRYQLNLDK